MPSVPQLLKTVFLTLGGEDFSLDVVDAALVPTPGDVQRVTTLDGVTHSDVASESWALNITAVIDWDSDRPGLAWYLWENRDDSVAFVFGDTTGAISATKPRMGGTVKLVPIAYGGAGNEYATAEVSLPLDGDPIPDITP